MQDRAYLRNTIRPYHWGSTTAIAQIQGRSATGGPEAELWIGAHHAAPSSVVAELGSTQPVLSLPDLLKRDGSRWLGESQSTFGQTLPFLLKILAAAEPLSIQVHPDRDRAEASFNSRPDQPYVDANHKPELLCALTSFSALHGFRRLTEIAEMLSPLSELPARIGRCVAMFSQAPSASALRELLARLMTLSATDIAVLHTSVTRLLRAPSLAVSDETLKAIELIERHYPLDALIVAPLLLNVVALEPGQAIYTGPRVLHSYLEGTGVEIMATSDNVLRAGLTSKPTATSELLHVTNFDEQPSNPVETESREGSAFIAFVTAAAEFELGRLHWDAPSASTEPNPKEIQILLCTDGEFRIDDEQRSDRQRTLPSGEALLVAANSGSYTVKGSGLLFRATVPNPNR